MSKKTNILLHKSTDKELLDMLAKILDGAVKLYPDSWDEVVDVPGRLDHYGFHNSTLSTVVLSEEPRTQFMRLSLRPGLHPVFDVLSQAYLNYAFGVDYTKAEA